MRGARCRALLSRVDHVFSDLASFSGDQPLDAIAGWLCLDQTGGRSVSHGRRTKHQHASPQLGGGGQKQHTIGLVAQLDRLQRLDRLDRLLGRLLGVVIVVVTAVQAEHDVAGIRAGQVEEGRAIGQLQGRDRRLLRVVDAVVLDMGLLVRHVLGPVLRGAADAQGRRLTGQVVPVGEALLRGRDVVDVGRELVELDRHADRGAVEGRKGIPVLPEFVGHREGDDLGRGHGAVEQGRARAASWHRACWVVVARTAGEKKKKKKKGGQ